MNILRSRAYSTILWTAWPFVLGLVAGWIIFGYFVIKQIEERAMIALNQCSEVMKEAESAIAAYRVENEQLKGLRPGRPKKKPKVEGDHLKEGG